MKRIKINKLILTFTIMTTLLFAYSIISFATTPDQVASDKTWDLLVYNSKTQSVKKPVTKPKVTTPKVVKADPVKEFTKYINNFILSYKTNDRRHIVYTEKTAYWDESYTKLRYDINPKYSIDVSKTNSLTSPYTAICKFIINVYSNGDYETEDEANNNDNFALLKTETHIHKYAYQNGKWVYISGIYDYGEGYYSCDGDTNADGYVNLDCKEIK